MQKSHTTCRAFTLLELLLVMIMMSSLAVVAFPLWYGANHQLSATKEDLIQAILFVQHTAMVTGKNTFIAFDDSGQFYTGYRKDFGGNSQILPTRFLNNPITINSTQSQLEFDGIYGLPLTSPNDIEIIGEETLSFSIDSTGEIVPHA